MAIPVQKKAFNAFAGPIHKATDVCIIVMTTKRHQVHAILYARVSFDFRYRPKCTDAACLTLGPVSAIISTKTSTDNRAKGVSFEK